MSRVPRLGLSLWLLGAVSCGYYNGMWSADRFAAQARRQERAGRREEARASWAAAAVKAESVMVHHPHGRWVDAALVLRGEGLAKSGACNRATELLARALASVHDAELRGRAAIAAAECDLDAMNASAADQVLQPLVTSPRRALASRAAYLSGRVAELRGDPRGAARWYAASGDPQAGPARARVLLAAGPAAAALAYVDTLAHGRYDEAMWTQLLAAVANSAGRAAASRMLDQVLATGHLRTGSRARLLLADGDRLLSGDSLGAADARYHQVAALVPDSLEGPVARARRVRVQAAQCASLDELRVLGDHVDQLAQSAAAGVSVPEARALLRLIRSVLDAADSAGGLPFRAAELARDSLRAPRLAVSVLLSFADAHPASIFAPKAIIAAAAGATDERDSLIVVLHASYSASPYVLALAGDPSPAYAVAEDSLARALGVLVTRPQTLVASLIAPPVPGPRGPPFDPIAPEQVEGPGRGPPRTAGRGSPRDDDAPVRSPARRPPPVQP